MGVRLKERIEFGRQTGAAALGKGVVMKSAIHSFALVLAIVWPLALTAPPWPRLVKSIFWKSEKGDRGYWKTTYDADPLNSLDRLARSTLPSGSG